MFKRNEKKRFYTNTVLCLCGPASAWVANSQTAHKKEDIQALIELMKTPKKDIPLGWIIEATSGFSILDWEGEEREALERAAAKTLTHLKTTGVKSKRVNEVGGAVERILIEALRESGFQADIPKAQSGKKRSTGYPDLWSEKEGKTFYIEVKTYNGKNVNTTQRSFYLSPSSDFKVTTDAYHLLVAFEMKRAGEGHYLAERFKLLDLFELKCDLKYEFNASNRDLYGSGLIISEE